jgi:RNA polymerase sigma-70 factor (ECF subfamily)
VVLVHQAVEEALAAIRALPPLQAEVLMLRLVAGLSSDVVAELVDSTPGAVRVAAHRGLKRLSQQLDRTGVTR